MGSEDFFGERRRRDHHRGHKAEFQFHDGAVSTSELGEGLVGKISELEEVADDRKWPWTGGKVEGPRFQASPGDKRDNLDQAPEEVQTQDQN